MCPSTYSNVGNLDILDCNNFGYLNQISLDVFSDEKVPYKTVTKPSKCGQIFQDLPISGLKTSTKNASLKDQTEKCKNNVSRGSVNDLNITGNSPPNYVQKTGIKTSENMIPLPYKIGLENGLHCGKNMADLAETLGENDPLLVPIKPPDNSKSDQILEIHCSNEKLNVTVEDSVDLICPNTLDKIDQSPSNPPELVSKSLVGPKRFSDIWNNLKQTRLVRLPDHGNLKFQSDILSSTDKQASRKVKRIRRKKEESKVDATQKSIRSFLSKAENLGECNIGKRKLEINQTEENKKLRGLDNTTTEGT